MNPYSPISKSQIHFLNAGFSQERIELSLLLLGVYLLAVTLNPSITSDGLIRFTAVEAIISGEAIPIIKLSLIQAVLSLPLAYTAKLVGLPISFAVSYFNFFTFLILGTSILLSLKRIYSPRIALLTFLVLLSASVLPHHLQLYFGEVCSAFAICAGLLLTPKSYVRAALLIGLGVANTPALLPPALVGSLLLIKKRPAFLCGIAVATLLILLENYFKYGSISQSPYLLSAEKGMQTFLPYSGNPGFSYPIFFGILSVILSFGKGIIFYIPNLLVLCNSSLLKKMRLQNIYGVALACSITAVILVYAKWWAWYGGDFWGPRFFLILTVPAAIALATLISSMNNASNSKTLLLLALMAIATWVGIDGVIFGQFHMELCWTNNYQYEMFCWYTPEFSALWRPFVVLTWRELFTYIVNSERFAYALWQAIVFIYLSALVITSRKMNKVNISVSSNSITLG